MTGSTRPPSDLEIPSARESSGKFCIGSEALRRLRRSGYSALRDVSCDVHGGDMRLIGRLRSYYLKQVAQAVVADIEGVHRVVNLIEIAVTERSPEGGA